VKRRLFDRDKYTPRAALRQAQFLLAQRDGHALILSVGGFIPHDWHTFTAAQRRGYLSGISQAFDDYTTGAADA
jgi:hypothetical protein